jgi:two-component system cell cycle response regulator DivK
VSKQNGAAVVSQPNGQETTVKTILIVEDNDLNMKLFHALLETRGYNVLQARDGMEGLRLARERHPDLIIMDIQLPGVSGLVVAKSIKDDEALKNIPIIAVTAFALKGDEERMREGGCAAYLAKPISTPVFLKTVAEYLN